VKKEQYFRNKIKSYYKTDKREFFWRKNDLNPFQIMITELFLKKTKAETVEKYCYNFVKKYNCNKKMKNLCNDEIYKSIKFLGLSNQRTKSIIKICEYLHINFNDELPNNYKELIKIPYIGDYTASAIMCFAFNQRYTILDVNSSRVISRFFSIDNDKDLRDNSSLKQKTLDLLPRKDIKEYNWGLLDLGAVTCKTKPLCSECILKNRCEYHYKL
jgi:A/G-specific adenine glycosylase